MNFPITRQNLNALTLKSEENSFRCVCVTMKKKLKIFPTESHAVPDGIGNALTQLHVRAESLSIPSQKFFLGVVVLRRRHRACAPPFTLNTSAQRFDSSGKAESVKTPEGCGGEGEGGQIWDYGKSLRGGTVALKGKANSFSFGNACQQNFQ